MGSCDTWKKTYICTSTIPMGTKLGRVGICVRQTPPNKLRDLLITWACDKCKTLYLHFCNTYDHQTWLSGNLWLGSPTFKVTWPCDYVVMWHMQKKYICFSITPMATTLGRVVAYVRKTPPTKVRDLLMTHSHKKCKRLYLHFHNTYGYQTWQSDDLRSGDASQLFTWPFDYVVTWRRKNLITALPQYQ